MNTYLKVFLSLTLLGLSSCASVDRTIERPAAQPAVTKEQKIERNYELGKGAIGYVGEAIVQRRVFEVSTTEVTTSGLVAADDFVMNYPPFGSKVYVKKGDQVEVVGTTERDGRSYRVVRLAGGVPGVGLLVDEQGSFEGSGLSLMLGNSRMGYTYRVSPATAKLTQRADVASKTEPLHRAELIFLGGSKDAIRLRFQEFGRESPTRPIRAVEIVHRLDRPSLSMGPFVVRVTDADNERIHYVVMSDAAH